MPHQHTVYPAGVPFAVILSDLDNGDWGECDAEHRIIRVEQALPQRDQDRTELHEFLHALLAVTGWADLLGDQHEEGIVQMLESHLWPLIDVERLREPPSHA